MTICFLEEEIPGGANGENLSSGVFPVGKDAAQDRTIVDRRPKNWAEVPWPAPRLPHPVSFTRKVLRENRRVVVWALDLPDYYHHLDGGLEHAREVAG